MPDERTRDLAREWVAKAENDLTTAACVLRLGKECPTDSVCFHAQQCIEKYLKAMLVVLDIDFPRTHDIQSLVALLSGSLVSGLSLEEQRRLTAYATVTRYPGSYQPASLGEARSAVRLARGVRSRVRKELPRRAMRVQGRA